MRVMLYVVLWLPLSAACGRLGYDSAGEVTEGRGVPSTTPIDGAGGPPGQEPASDSAVHAPRLPSDADVDHDDIDPQGYPGGFDAGGATEDDGGAPPDADAIDVDAGSRDAGVEPVPHLPPRIPYEPGGGIDCSALEEPLVCTSFEGPLPSSMVTRTSDGTVTQGFGHLTARTTAPLGKAALVASFSAPDATTLYARFAMHLSASLPFAGVNFLAFTDGGEPWPDLEIDVNAIADAQLETI